MSAEKRLLVADPAAMHALGVKLGAMLRAGDLVILSGPLGAGKTTLTRGIGEGLQVRGPVQSPTFVLARTHPSLIDGPPLVHVDAYRLASAWEVEDLDIDYAASVVVAEWGEGKMPVTASYLQLHLCRPSGAAAHAAADNDYASEIAETRTVTITAYGKRWENEKLPC